MPKEKQDRTTEDLSQPSQEYFSNIFWTSLSPWSATITFGLPPAGPDEQDIPKIRVQMPLQLAKALAVLLSRAVRRHERETNVAIELPDNLLESLGITPEEWKHFTEEDK